MNEMYFIIWLPLILFVLYLFTRDQDVEARLETHRGLRQETKKKRRIDLDAYFLNYIKNMKPPQIAPDYRLDVEAALYAAGEPADLRPADIVNMERFFSVLLGVFGTLVLWQMFDIAWMQLAGVVMLNVIIGQKLPMFDLAQRAKKRKKDVAGTIASDLDMLSVCCSTGLSSLESLKSTATSSSGVLADEFKLIVSTVESGGTHLPDALTRFMKRIPTDDVREIARIFHLELEMGAYPVAESLATLSETIRQRQQENIRVAAAAAQNKSTFPIMFCIVPALILILITPVALSLKATIKM